MPACQQAINYKEKLVTAKDCCKTYADIRFKKLDFKDPLSQQVGDEESPAMSFPEGKSFFMAIEFPEFKIPFEINIESLPTYNQLFVPTLLLLDRQYRVVRRIEDSSFQYSNGKTSYKFFINYEDKNIHYMVVYTRSGIIGKTNHSVTTQQATIPIFAGAYVINYTTHSEVKNKIKNARGGNLNVVAKEYKLRNISDDPNRDHSPDF